MGCTAATIPGASTDGGSVGTVVSIAPVACDASLPSRATCTTLVVRCPGIEDLQATAAVTEPSGGGLKGTLFAHAGGDGTSYYSENISTYLAAGLRVVQVKWASSWEQTQPSTTGVLTAACRPATVMKWAFDNPHGQNRTLAFCGVGHSGGSGVLAYSLAHYGMGDYLDYAALTAGPPFGRIDYGCAPQTYSGPPRMLCPELPDASVQLPSSTLNTWEHTTTCGSSSPPAADVQRWAADSIVSQGATYSYPRTVVTFWDCAVNPNGTTGGAFFYSQAITSQKSVTCFTSCRGEDLGSSGWAAQAGDLVRQCVPRH